MCILFIALNIHPTHPLILASNRDEFFDRPTAPMSLCTRMIHDENAKNEEQDCIKTNTSRKRTVTSLAGKDLVAGGTWLGVDVSHRHCVGNTIKGNDANIACKNDKSNNTNTLRWIALTNYIDGEIETTHNKTSRGSILTEYLDMDPQKQDAESFTRSLCTRGQEYNGFSVLIADATGVYYCTNRKKKYTKSTTSENKSMTTPLYECTYHGPLPPGIYGLSNGLLDSPWAKIQRGKSKLSELIYNETIPSTSEFHESLMKLLSDDLKPTNTKEQYPDSNRSSIYVPEFELDGRAYGTRSSTTILMDNEGRVSVLERNRLTSEDSWFDLFPE